MAPSVKLIPGVHDTPLLENWQQILKLKDEYGFERDRWTFRGQEDATWELRSTFERSREGGGNEPAWKYEAATLREFTRRAHHYVNDLPDPWNTLEWLALIRHYGAPSRLLDCTYSFYIAAYFALQRSTERTGLAAVWAINTSWLKEVYRKQFPGRLKRRNEDFRFKEPPDFKKHFLIARRPARFVAPVNPYRLNERLSAQRGLFLCPGDLDATFMKNLLPDKSRPDKERVVRVLIDYSLKTNGLRELRRMNVNAATLFPDLAGFALSLHDWFYLPLNFTEKDLRLVIEGHFPGDRY